MNVEFADKWITELRSGKWKQHKGQLANNYRTAHCCLGVACEISGIEPNFNLFKDRWEWESDSSILPFSLAKRLEMNMNLSKSKDSEETIVARNGKFMLPNGVTLVLSELNDAGFTFNQIADVIDYYKDEL